MKRDGSSLLVSSPARSLRHVVEAHLGSREVARVIYGAIVGVAVVVALEDHPPPVGEITATIAGTAVAVALAELYSEYIGTVARTRRRVDDAQLRHLIDSAAAAMFGAGFPACFFLLAAVGAMSVSTAFVFAKWTAVTLICCYGFLAGRLSGRTVSRALLHAAALGAVGAALIALKALVH